MTVQLESHEERGVPRTLLTIAKSARDAAAKLAKREGDPLLNYDDVWLVFDRDEHEEFNAVISEAADADFQLAVSNPCFELWLYLHFHEQPGMQHRHDMQAKMKSCVGDYDKHVDFKQFAPHVDTAAARARRLNDDAESRDEQHSNPTTTVFRIIERYRKSD